MEALAAENQPQLTKKQKKAAKRAALIQDIAEAVYSLGVQRQNEIAAKHQMEKDAHKTRCQAERLAEQATYNAAHPIGAAFYKENPVYVNNFVLKQYLPSAILKWAIAKSILPAGTIELPNTAEQYIALARAAALSIPQQTVAE
jgi:hypothetical protein